MRPSVIAALFVLVAVSAQAAAVSSAQGCIAVVPGAFRVAAMVANPADCCTGRLQCAQFLSTTTVVRPAHDQRT